MDLNILGIGPLEVLFFVVLLLLLFGPTDLVKMARRIGAFINRMTRSQNFQAIQQTSAEIRKLPERLIQEAQLDDLQQALQPELKEIQQAAQPLQDLQRTLVSGAPAPSPSLSSTPRPAPPPAAPARPAFAAWTQELPDPAAADSAFTAWTQELPGTDPTLRA